MLFHTTHIDSQCCINVLNGLNTRYYYLTKHFPAAAESYTGRHIKIILLLLIIKASW